MSDPWDKYNGRPEYLVMSAGSMGGLSLIGVWRALEEAGLTAGLKGFAGSSIGAVFALLFTLGYESEELQRLAHKLSYNKLADLQLLGLLSKMGVESGKGIMKLLRGLLKAKTGRRELTFREHWNITGKYLCIAASCTRHEQCDYFSVSSTPDMSVLQSIRMSIAIPWVITPVPLGGCMYVDGALFDPCPALQFPVQTTLVILIQNETMNTADLHNFAQYTLGILFGVYKRLHAPQYERIMEEYRTIEIHTGAASMTFSMNREERKRTIETGYRAAKEKLWV